MLPKTKRRYVVDEPNLFNDKERVMKDLKITSYTLPIFIKNSEYYECYISNELSILIKISTEVNSINICYNHYTNKNFGTSGFDEFILYKLNNKKNDTITAVEFYDKALGGISDEFIKLQELIFSMLPKEDIKAITDKINQTQQPEYVPAPKDAIVEISNTTPEDDEPF